MTKSQTTFKTLMEQVRAGSEEAACELLERYGPQILTVVRRHLRERLRTQYDSRDFEQDVWASFFADPPPADKVDGPEALVAFLLAVAKHKVLDATRRSFHCHKRDINREFSLDGSANQAAEGVVAPDPTPSAAAAARERWERLPDRDRRILELLLEGRPREEIAAELGITERTMLRVIRRFLRGETS